MRRGPGRQAADDAGFTLVEVLVSLSLIAVVVSATAGFLVRAMKTTHVQADRETAAQLVAGELARAADRPLPAGSAPGGTTTARRTVAGVAYDIITTSTLCWQAHPAASCAPTQSTGAVRLVRVEVAVSWAPGSCLPESCHRASLLVDGTNVGTAAGSGLEPT